MKTLEVPESEYIQMKEELESLKKLVSENLKLNEPAIRQAMQRKADEISGFALRIIILCQAMMCVIPSTFFRFYHVSSAFVIASELMMLVCIVATVVMHYPVRSLDCARGSLVDVADRMSRFKRQYARWPRIGIPMVTLWLGWLMYEIYTGMGYENQEFFFLCTGLLCGAVLGGSIGFRMNRRMVRKADDVLEEVKQILRP